MEELQITEKFQFKNPFAQLVYEAMKEERKKKKSYNVAVYNVQKKIAQGLREYLNPSSHLKGTKKDHIDLEVNGTVQKINLAWNSAVASQVRPDSSRKKSISFGKFNKKK